MSDMGRLVSGLSAHLDQVERECRASTITVFGGKEVVLHSERLGLVGASRDLITQWRREASHHASEAQRRASYARFPPAELDVERRKGRIAGLEAALVVVARGWGVDTDDKEDGGG